MRSFYAAAILLGAAFASPYPDSAAQHTRTTRAQAPCAQVSSAQANGDVMFDADTVLACLKSVPLDSRNAPVQLLGLQTMVDFQSTLAYLKNPPEGYEYPAVDIKGSLNKISDSVQNGDYKSEYDFQVDLYNLVLSAHDQHFNYIPDILGVFAFFRSNNLFSVSKDGKALPDIYMDLDIQVLSLGGNNYTVSPITQINGQAVEDFLDDLSKTGNAQDPDSNYNSIFPVIPLEVTGLIAESNPPLFQQAYTYQGGSTEVTFKNGTTRKIDTYAMASDSLKGVNDGASFFAKFCQVQTFASSSALPSGSMFPSASLAPSASGSFSASGFPSASASASGLASSASAPAISPISTVVSYSPVPSQTVVPAPVAYPKPWVVASDFSAACYFPEDDNDLAVLSVPTFEPAVPTEFSDIMRQCLATSSKMGKKKFVIDLRGNGGGTVLLAYDYFKQLFPGMTPWGATNFRAFDLFNDIGETVTEYYMETDHGPETLHNNFASIFNVDDELNKMQQDFDSWEQFYGPVHIHGDTFTNLVRYNLSDRFQTQDIGVSGYGNLTNITPKQTFSADNILLLQDGACASTCTVFAEFMKTQGKVKSVAIGGRSQYGPMQGVGGVKGANVYTNDYLLQIMSEAFTKDADKAEQRQLASKYETDYLAMTYATLRTVGDSTNGHAARVNIRNNIRQGDTTVTPLQFVYEAANCRLFYTAPMIFDQSMVWSAAYKANWGDGSNCVQGSTGQNSSKPGTSYIPGEKNGDDKEGAAGRTTLGFGGMMVGIMSMGLALFML